MSLFLLTFLAVYGGMNAWFFWRLSSALALGRWKLPVGLILVLMILAPMLVRWTENSGREALARILAYAGYSWMGILLLFVTMSLLVEFCRLVSRVAGVGEAVLPAASFYVPLAFALVMSTYGFFEAARIRTERIVIRSPKVPKEAGELRIVQVSDVHLGLLVRERRLEKILREVEAARPDILVASGDTVDGQLADLSRLREMLERVRPPLGKFAVTGNHEYYARIDQSLAFLRSCGFTVLDGKTATPNSWLTLAGVDDPVSRRFGGTTGEAGLLVQNRGVFTLLLKHRPEIAPESRGNFDLQLSGHVHQGQIFPFVFVTRLSYPVPTGLSSVTSASSLYVSRGSGTWGPPMRVLAPPEVTVIRLVHGDTFSAANE